MPATWQIDRSDCLDWLAVQPADSIDLVFGSPPYESARLYLEGGEDKGIARDTEVWVAWMVKVVQASLRVCTGLVVFVVEGQTKNYAYSGGPLLLAADLIRAGICLRKPPIYHRVGIPGSGGPDWLRNDYEFVICATRGGKLPWSDNTVMGHPPKWAPGGEMSNRLANGARVNQWGMRVKEDGTLTATDPDAAIESGDRRPRSLKPSHVVVTDKVPDGPGLFGVDETPPKPPVKNAFGVNTGRPVGTRPTGDRGKGKNAERENYRAGKVIMTRPRPGQHSQESTGYEPPVLANPGNVIHLKVGGGLMGDDLCHDNEAPFPEALAEFFIRSFCLPGGTVCDLFSGSGTTAKVAVSWSRNFRGCDIRESQVELTKRRLASVQQQLFVE